MYDPSDVLRNDKITQIGAANEFLMRTNSRITRATSRRHDTRCVRKSTFCGRVHKRIINELRLHRMIRTNEKYEIKLNKHPWNAISNNTIVALSHICALNSDRLNIRQMLANLRYANVEFLYNWQNILESNKRYIEIQIITMFMRENYFVRRNLYEKLWMRIDFLSQK